MSPPQDYVLFIGQPPIGLQSNQIVRCPIVIADSVKEAIATAQSHHPYLVILAGDSSQPQLPRIARQIRQCMQPEEVMIVSLTASSDLAWEPQTGSPEIDGFLVEPLSVDVLSSLNESAMAKQKILQPV